MKTLNDLKQEPLWAVAKAVPPRNEGQHPGKITVDPQLLLNEGKMRNLKSTEATGWTRADKIKPSFSIHIKRATCQNMTFRTSKNVKTVLKNMQFYKKSPG